MAHVFVAFRAEMLLEDGCLLPKEFYRWVFNCLHDVCLALGCLPIERLPVALSATTCRVMPLPVAGCGYWDVHGTSYASSPAQGGGGSFKNRKPIGEIGCCESPMAEQQQ